MHPRGVGSMATRLAVEELHRPSGGPPRMSVEGTTQRLEHLLECLIQVVARATIPEEQVREIVDTGKKQLSAFNLCDGTRKLSDVASRVRLDRGNLSRAASRWVQSSAAFWIGEGTGGCPRRC